MAFKTAPLTPIPSGTEPQLYQYLMRLEEVVRGLTGGVNDAQTAVTSTSAILVAGKMDKVYGVADDLAVLDGSGGLKDSELKATPTPTAGAVPVADSASKLDAWVSDAAAGTAGKVALESVEPGAVSSSTSGAVGTATTAARGDHSHDLGTHAHSGETNGGQIAHTALTSIGTNTHAQIDTFLGLATATPTAGALPLADSSGSLDAWVTGSGGGEDFFGLDINGDLVPLENPTTSPNFELDSNSDIQPKV